MVNPPQPLAVDYFDGRSARATPALLQVQDGSVRVAARDPQPANEVELDHALLSTLRWPERTRGGVRLLHLPGGGSVQGPDAGLWDAWVAQQVRLPEGWAVRAQQNWRLSLSALVLLLGVLVAGYLWGLPWAARHSLALVPHAVDAHIGEATLPQLDKLLLGPSRLDTREQRDWTQRFARTVQRAYPGGDAPAYTLVFRSSRIGPNAMALPGGSIVITDELIAMAREAGELADDMVLGVLAHELGHVQHRHGMQHLVSTTVLGVVTGTLIGDYSGLLAAVPLWLGQARYSRDAERQADDEARRVMLAGGLSPLAMVRFFELARVYQAREAKRLCEQDALEKAQQREQVINPGSTSVPEVDASACARAGEDRLSVGIAIASHPPDAERMEAFRRAAGR